MGAAVSEKQDFLMSDAGATQREAYRGSRLLLGSVLLLAAACASTPIGQIANSQEASRVTTQAVVEVVKPRAGERQRVLHEVIANLKEHYVDRAVAQKMGEALLAHEKAGDYEAIDDGAGFAALLTRHLREVSHDMHLEVVYSQNRMSK